MQEDQAAKVIREALPGRESQFFLVFFLFSFCFLNIQKDSRLRDLGIRERDQGQPTQPRLLKETCPCPIPVHPLPPPSGQTAQGPATHTNLWAHNHCSLPQEPPPAEASGKRQRGAVDHPALSIPRRASRFLQAKGSKSQMGERKERKMEEKYEEGGGVGRKEKREERGTEGEREQRRDDEEERGIRWGIFFKICIYNIHHVPGTYCTL